MLLRHLDDHGAQQQQRDQVRDGHEAVERVGDIPHERQIRDRAGHNDEAEDDLIGADDLAAKEELRAARAVERPAEDGGCGKQQQADRQNDRARLRAEDAREARDRGRNARSRVVAVIAVRRAGAEDDKGRERADDDGIHKDLKDAVKALLDGVSFRGGGVRDGRGAEARLVGENAAADALGHRKLDGHARRAAGDGSGVKSSLEDGSEHAGNGADIRKHDNERADDVDDGHEGHELFRDLTDALDAAEQHQRDEDGDANTGDEADHRLPARRVFIERDGNGLDGIRDGVHLCDVADTEGRDRAEDGEHTAEPLPLRTEAVFNVVHGAAAPVALFIAFAVLDSERDLGELGHHAEKRRHPHPEHGAGAA